MKKRKLIKFHKIYIIPLILAALISFFASFLIYNNSRKKYNDIYIETTMSYSNSYAEQIVKNKEAEGVILELLYERLDDVTKVIIDQIDLINEQYLNDLTNEYNVRNIVYFDMDGNVIYDASGNNYDYEIKDGDYIDNFIQSGLEIYKEDVRKSINSDNYNLYYYRKTDENHFVQVALEADEVNSLTENYTYPKVLNSIVTRNEQVLNSFVLTKEEDNKYSYVFALDVPEYEVHELDKFYKEAFNGKTVYRQKHSRTMDTYLLEIVSPIKENGEIKEIISVYFTLEFYNEINQQTVIILTVLSISLLIVFSFLGLYFFIIPLNVLENSLSSFDALNANYEKPVKEPYIFKGAFNALDDLKTHIKSVNKENANLNEDIYKLALTDYLTSLPNRMSLIETVNKFINLNEKFALIFIDINNFKTYNDTKGHIFGDKLLINISKKIKETTYKDMYLSRYGGDEFIILMPYRNKDEIIKYSNDLYDLFQEPIKVGNEYFYIELAIGVSKYPIDALNSTELIRKADIAMYYGKDIKQERFIFYEKKIDEHFKEELTVKEKIEDALINDGFKIVLQPQVKVSNNKIISYEALARFKDEKIGPNIFIEVAESYGLINALGKVIIDKVINTLKIMINDGSELKTIYVNFSIKQLRNTKLIDYILNELNKNNIETKYFGIEITENVLIENEKGSISFFNKLKAHGFKVAIDDFGSGNASLNYLIEYPLRIVKLDRGFVNKYLTKDKLHIFNKVLDLAIILEYKVLAEGIETKEQVNLLKQTQCNYAQGYYYYKPMDVKHICKLEEDIKSK